jgi:hypothetical protein
MFSQSKRFVQNARPHKFFIANIVAKDESRQSVPAFSSQSTLAAHQCDPFSMWDAFSTIAPPKIHQMHVLALLPAQPS